MLWKPTYQQINARGYWNHNRYYDCVAHWLCHEGGGLTVYDVSGYKNDGTLTNGTTWSGGRFGPALVFDGTNDYVALPATIILGGGASYSFWIRPAGTGFRCVLGQADDHGIFVSDLNDVRVYISGVNVIQTATTVPQDQWTHVALTWNGVDSQLYLNGLLSTTDTEPPKFNVAFIGSDRLTFDESFEGGLDDIRLYDRALLPAEVASLYSDPFLEFRQPRRHWFNQVAAAVPARGLALLGVGR